MTDHNREERPFQRDVVAHGGYLYTTNQSWSARTAIDRQTQSVLSITNFAEKRVVDIGCGDGAATLDLYDRGRPVVIEALDPAEAAVAVGQSRAGGRAVNFRAGSAYALPREDQSFDIAHLRGVLHHMDDPERAVREAARVARQVVVLEPNGLNPVLKVIEKISRYHREHGERSFLPATLRRWMVSSGLRLVRTEYCCLVPYFCPEPTARVLKRLEHIVEAIPLVRQIGCGAYVLRGNRI